MEFQASARKWRPDSFQDVIAQEHVATTLTNAIKKGRVGHSYIFSGPRGVGKTTAARIFSKSINCLNPNEGNPCNTCENCTDIKNNRFIDLFEIDGASNNGVDNVRDIRDALRYPPQKGKYKTYIIDEVHMLSIGAFNALLKTLEEPPPYAVFIFATTEIHKVPATILSRCQRFDFRRITTSEIMDRLRFICKEEDITCDEESLLIIAKKADGAMRDGLSILDQVVSFFGKSLKGDELSHILNVVEQELFFQATDFILNHDVKGMLSLIDSILIKGYDLREFIQGMAEHVRNLLVVVTTGESKLLDISESYRERYLQSASHYHYGDLIRYLNLLSDADIQIKNSNNPRLKLELTMSKLCTMENVIHLSELLKKINKLEKLLDKSGNTVLRPSEPIVEYQTKSTSDTIISQRPIPPVAIKKEVDYTLQTVQSAKSKPTFPTKATSTTHLQSNHSTTVPINISNNQLIFEDFKATYRTQFLDYAKTNFATLFSILSHSDVCSWNGQILTLKVARKFDEEQIVKQIIDVQNLLSEFYKVPLQISTKLQPEDAGLLLKEDVNIVFNELKKNNPIVQFLSDQLDIEPV